LKAIQRVLAGVRDANAELAESAVLTADLILPSLTPEQLMGLQDALRRQIVSAERRLTAQRKRRGRRGEALRGLHRGTPEQRKARAAHLLAIEVRDEELRWQRQLLRQVGDAVAWSVLKMEHDLVAPLWAENKSFLPEGIGLGGQVVISQELLRTGRFLSLEADLTRCIGVCDLVVVPFGADWRMPSLMELKSRGRFAIGESVGLEIHTAAADDAQSEMIQVALQEVFASEIEPSIRQQRNQDPRLAKQQEQMMASAELLDNLTSTMIVGAGAPPTGLMKVLANVLGRGEREGKCWDSAESGIAYAAVRVSSADPKGHVEKMRAQLWDAGFDDKYQLITVDDFFDKDEWAAVIPPIPHWKLPRHIRISLLSRDLFFACLVHKDLWKRALGASGLELVSSSSGWEIRLEGRSIQFDWLSVRRLELGVAFAGISPRQASSAIRRLLEDQAPRSDVER